MNPIHSLMKPNHPKTKLMQSSRNRKISLALAGSIAALLAAPAAHAASLTWDITPGTVGVGNGSVTGGGGTWDTTNGNWTTDGGANNIAWVNANLDTAVFGGALGAVALGSNIDVGGLRFDTTGYSIATTGFSLNFADTVNPNTILFNNIAAATITGPVGGAGNVIVSRSNPTTAGTLTLNGTSTDGWTGTTTINNGMTLALAGSNQGLSDTTGITLNGGAITLTNVDNTEGALDRVAAVGITSNGGTITYTNTNTGTAYAETLGTVALTTGQLNVVSTNQVTSGTQTLTLGVGSLTHAVANTSAITFSGASLGLDARNSIIVSSQADSAVGEIIGPWATWGTTAAAQTDYATYNRTAGGAVNAFGIQNANIAATAENSGSWIGGANVTLSGATTLTATRTVNSLRYTGGANALALGASNFNLETYGLLNGGSGLLTISTTGTGALTTPTGGGNLFLTAGNNAITVSAPINNNGGNVTLVKSGSGTLTLSSTTSNFSGGVVLNAGTLQISADTNLGNTSNGITVNGNATLISPNGITLSSNRTVSLNNNATLSFIGVGTSDYNITIGGAVTGNGGIALVHTDYNVVTLSSTGNSFSGPIQIGRTSGTTTQHALLTVNSLADSANPITFGNHNGAFTSSSTGQRFDWGGGAIAPLVLNNRYFVLGGTGSGVIRNVGAHTITVNTDLQVTAAGNKALILAGSNTGLNTFAGRIPDGTGAVISLTKTEGGTWFLTGANTYTGATTISGGTLRINTINDVGGGASAIGAPTTGANGTIAIGSGGTGAALVYTGAAFDTDRVINLAGTTGGATLDQSGTGLLKFSSNFTATGAGIKTLTLQGSTTGTGEISGQIVNGSGTTSVAKSGTGTWTISGTNNYTGTTTASNGTLSLTGSLTGSNVSTSGTGILDQSAAGAIAGAGATFAHGGTLTSTLAGTNSYGGTTTITAGVLRVTGSTAGGAVTVSGGALGGTGTVGGAVSLTTAGGINLADGVIDDLALSSTLASTGAANTNNLRFDLASAGSTADKLSVTGTTTVTNTGAAVISPHQIGGSGNRIDDGTYTLIGGAGTLDATNFGRFHLATTKAFGMTFALSNPVGDGGGDLALTTTKVTAAAGNVALTTGSGSWAAGGSFTPGNVPDYESNVTINTAVGTTPLNGSTDINSLTFGTGATAAVTISAGTATAGTPASMLVIEARAVNGNTAGNGITLNNASGTHTISANIGLAASQTWTVATGAGLTVSGVISDFGGGYGLTKAGGGTMTLSGVNTFTGPLTIANGTVRADGNALKGTNGLLGAGTTVVLGASGQTGRLAIFVDGATTIDRDITLATGGTGEIQFGNFGAFQNTNADRSLSLSGNINGSGNFTKLGGSAVVLSGNNIYSGTTTVNEGALRLSSATALPGGIGATGGTSPLTINGNGSINVGATIQLTAASGDFLRALGTGADQFQITGGVSGFDANGSARQVIVGNNAAFELQWGIATFNPSALLLGFHQYTATGAITLQNKIDLNAATRTITVNTGAAIATISGAIRTTSGTAGITKTGGGTLELSGNNTYNGPTTISAGTLTLSSAGAVGGTSQIVLGGTSTLHVNFVNLSLDKLVTGGAVPLGTFLRYSQAQTAAGSSNGPGTILGTVELNVTNVNPNYTLDFGGSISTLTNLVTATYNSPITLSGSSSSINASTTSAPFTGGTGMTVGASTAGAKTLILTGTLAGNTLGGVIGNGSGNVAVTKTNSGSWALTGANTYSGATTVSAGTLTLSGANGAIGSSAVTIAGGTLTISNANAASNSDRLSGSLAFTMNGGTFNFNNDASAGNSFSESAGTLTLIGGANTVGIQQAIAGQTSTLTFAGLSRTAGAINFSGAGLGAAVDPRSTITFTSAPTLTNGIIGPWATVGGTTYATLIGNDVVAYSGALTDVNRGAGGTKAIADGSTTDVRIIESGAAANITLGATTTTVRSILNSISGGIAATSTIAIGASETLRVDSINAVATTLALAVGNVANTGTLTPATAGGNLLLVNSSSNTMTVNSVIANFTSASSITKDGSGVVKLTGTNTYSGGTFVNAGTLLVPTNANLGDTTTAAGITFNGSAAVTFTDNNTTSETFNMGTRTITVNNGAIAALYLGNANKTLTTSGNITGSGGITLGRDPSMNSGGVGISYNYNLLGDSNSFSGAFNVGSGTEGSAGAALSVTINSLADSTSAITMNYASGFNFNLGSAAANNLSVPSRPINLLNSNATIGNQNASKTMTLGTVSTSTADAKTLNLGNGGFGSTIAGNITNGNGTIAVTKSGSGAWALSGTNTYSGVTNLSTDGGQLTILGKPALSPNTPQVVMARSTTLSLRMDDAGIVNLGNEIEISASDTSSGITSSYTIDVRNNGGATTGSTLVLGKLDFAGNPGNTNSSRRILTTGANGYRLQFGDVDLSHTILGVAAGGPQRFEPQSAPITIAGTVRQINGNTGSSTTDNNLYLGGIASGNLVSGIIADAADYPSNLNATPLNITKGEASVWNLSNANTYTGTTTITGGTLVANNLASGGSASSIGKASAAAANLVLGAGTLQYAPISAVGGAGATIDRNFTITGNGIIDASGTGALVFGQTGIISPDVTGLTGTTTLSSATITGLSSTANLAIGMGISMTGVPAGRTIASIDSATQITLNSGTSVTAGTNASSFGTPSARTLTLTGTNTDANTIAGILQNSSAAGAGALSLTKTGIGTWVLSGTNTYTGATTASAGTLVAGANAPSAAAGAFGNAVSEISLGVAGGNSDAGILIGGAFNVARTIRLATNNTTDTGTRVLTLGGSTAANSIFSGNIFLGTASQAGRGVTLTAASGGQVTFSGVIQNPGGMDPTTYTVTKAGAGTVVFSGGNLYTGLTAVGAGTLQLGISDGIKSGNAVTVAPTGASAVLDLAGFDQTIGGATGLTLGGATGSSVATVINSTGTSTLSLSGGGTAVTYNAANDPLGATISVATVNLADAAQTFTVGDSASVTGSGNELTVTSAITAAGGSSALVKAGAGALRLDGAQGYNTLTANGGTTNVNGSLTSGTAAVTVNNAGTILKFGSVSQTLSSLTIGAGATVVFTSGAASGSFSDGGGKAAGFGSPASSFGSGSAVVPEPGTIGLLLVGALGMLNRRRRQA